MDGAYRVHSREIGSGCGIAECVAALLPDGIGIGRGDMAGDVRARLVSALREWVAIPSVSAWGGDDGRMMASAEHFVERALDCGMSRAEVWATDGLPSVFAERVEDPDLPTVLIYAHHDVQPPEPLEEWDGDPFVVREDDGWLFGRGVSDDKSQVLVHLEGVRRLLRSHGRLPVNVRMIIDGEEEIGSPSFARLVEQRAEELRADALVVSDTSMPSATVPGLTVAARGLVYWELSVRVAASDLHSGAYGGAVQSASVVMAHVLASLRSLDGTVSIPGFYEDVRAPDESERAALGRWAGSDSELVQRLGAVPAGDPGYSTAERRALRPSLDVCGLWSGYCGMGPKTVIPAVAHAKLSSRLVPDQRPDAITSRLRDYIQRVVPQGVTFDLDQTQASSWLRVDDSGPAFRIAERVLGRLWDSPVERLWQGGSVPPVAVLRDALRVPVVMLGFGLPDNRNHAPNERVCLEQLERAVLTVEELWTAYRELRG